MLPKAECTAQPPNWEAQMFVTKPLLAAVFALALAAPAQALDEQIDRVFSGCLDSWPGDASKQVDCLSAAIDSTVEARLAERYQGLTPQETHERRVEMLMDSLEQLIEREQLIMGERFLGSPPLHCADSGSEGIVMATACDTKGLNIADAPPAQPH